MAACSCDRWDSKRHFFIVSTRTKKIMFNVSMALLSCPGQRCGPWSACGIGIGSTVDEQGDHIPFAPMRCVAQRSRRIFIVNSIDVRAVIEQQASLWHILRECHVVRSEERRVGQEC